MSKSTEHRDSVSDPRSRPRSSFPSHVLYNGLVSGAAGHDKSSGDVTMTLQPTPSQPTVA
jgi:hypothetical protein